MKVLFMSLCSLVSQAAQSSERTRSSFAFQMSNDLVSVSVDFFLARDDEIHFYSLDVVSFNKTRGYQMDRDTWCPLFWLEIVSQLPGITIRF
jgi:hypothetical protein